MPTSNTLPPPTADQAYFDVSALEAGTFTLPDELFITDAIPGATTRVPALSFLLIHSSSKEKLIFDLGIRRDWENLPPGTVEWIKSRKYNTTIEQDAVESLSRGNLTPDDISHVILSHLHWDHIGDPSLIPTSQFIVGVDCQPLLTSGYPKDPNSRFQSDLLPKNRTQNLDPTSSDWAPIGPFPRALDFYKDGSLYIVDAPGHLPGHINVLVRTSSDGGWLYLAGDSAHFWSKLTGKSKISVGAPWDPHFCMHVNKEESEATIERIKVLLKVPRVRILLAHDEPWYEKNKGGPAFWPGKIESL